MSVIMAANFSKAVLDLAGRMRVKINVCTRFATKISIYQQMKTKFLPVWLAHEILIHCNAKCFGSKSYITALLFAHNVTRLTQQSELNLSVSLIYLSKLKLIHYKTLGYRNCSVLAPCIFFCSPFPGTGTVLVPLMPVLFHSV